MGIYWVKIMKNKFKYLIVRDNNKKKITHFKYDRLEGYNLVQNKSKVVNGVKINKLVIVNKVFIEKAINKKIDKKFKSLLELIAKVFEDDSDPGNGLLYALNEIEKFKRFIINQHSAYMSKKQIELLDKKVKLIEKEIKMRLFQHQQQYDVKEIEDEKSNHHRR